MLAAMARIESLDTLQAQAVAALRSYQEDEETRTSTLKQLAAVFIAARNYFFTRDGDPDLLGQTAAYRRWVREVYSLANVPGAIVSSVQAAVRYHAGNLMREIHDDETIAALGLQVHSPRETSGNRHTQYREIVSLFGSGGAAITDADAIVGVARTIEVTLARIPAASVARLPVKERRRIADAVERVCELANDLADAAGVTK